ncbi:biotin--[acetyl-CoA-carboxylase] ligase [Peptostreptococcus equinus]|uniref:Bifunctional ligase/repressor BirA n=1 Tax=Peptostreptococcus equinus TaxID=3003601 RepID=A0ABY7JPH9_9FIRM|nr:biotin--[acetyl-CoA-carboxylase] ligase [Peptostreptococcus sp. CBA3647]WAW15005.1 biotin--[acetyl-CoA-carboxylase] ligase [Peptostreptococcus sp. CBA3647]
MNNTKDLIAEILLNNRDTYMSGESISERLNISRASVWKHINSLKKEGFIIESKNGSGYKLLSTPEKNFLQYELLQKLNTKYIGRNIHYFETIDSTNSQAKKIADKSREGTLIVSDEQTKGRGRIGKTWISKHDEGLYFSLILKPDIPIIKANFITQVAGASIIKALKNLGISATIKWPNDIILNSKKICGILTEMVAEIDKISYIVVGIGINLKAKSFDKTIQSIASSLLNEGYTINKVDLLVEFLKEFEYFYNEFLNYNFKPCLDLLRNNSAVIGKDIYIINKDKKTKVHAIDIDDNANLLIRYENGKIDTIYTGEISIRGLDSYI